MKYLVILVMFVSLNCATMIKTYNEVEYKKNDYRNGIDWSYVAINAIPALALSVANPGFGVIYFLGANATDAATNAIWRENAGR